MKKYLLLMAVIIGLTIMGCTRGEMAGGEPPEVFIEVGNERYETVLGTYCWNATCVDKAGPIELLEEKEPIQVEPGEKISVFMDYEPMPNEINLIQHGETDEREVLVKENGFTAPTQKGVYYYSYGVWWMDEKEENVSNGDAFYAFVLEVK